MSRLVVFALVLVLVAVSCSRQSNPSPFDEPAGPDSEYQGLQGLISGGKEFRDLSNQNPDLRLLPVEVQEALVERGSYLVKAVSACGVCHGAKSVDPDSALSGGRVVSIGKDRARASNITPDYETGIGSWSLNEVVTAIRGGVRRDGKRFVVDAHADFRWMASRDADAIALYLLSLAPVKNEVEKSGPRLASRFRLFRSSPQVEGYVPQLPQTSDPGYGRYLASSVSNCMSCHTPDKGLFGEAEEFSGDYSSSPDTGPGKALDAFSQGGPDIRGGSGLEDWTVEQIVYYLSSGVGPDEKLRASELCPWTYYRLMTQSDKLAIARFLKNL